MKYWSFKIVSGKYSDITYIHDNEYSFIMSEFNKQDIHWVHSFDDSDGADKINEILSLTQSVTCEFTGRSRIDNSPIFVLKYDDIRDCKLEILFNQEL